MSHKIKFTELHTIPAIIKDLEAIESRTSSFIRTFVEQKSDDVLRRIVLGVAESHIDLGVGVTSIVVSHDSTDVFIGQVPVDCRAESDEAASLGLTSESFSGQVFARVIAHVDRYLAALNGTSSCYTVTSHVNPHDAELTITIQLALGFRTRAKLALGATLTRDEDQCRDRMATLRERG